MRLACFAEELFAETMRSKGENPRPATEVSGWRRQPVGRAVWMDSGVPWWGRAALSVGQGFRADDDS